MMSLPPNGRLGASVGDMLVFMATLSLCAALLYPAWSVRDFRARVTNVIADVDLLASAARGTLRETSRWPTGSPPGEAPSELSSLGITTGLFNRTDYTMGWTVWEVVDSVEAPATPDIAAADDAPRLSEGPRMEPVVRAVGAVAVHASDQDLLAELMEHYGGETSFVLDTLWMFVLPERGAATGS